MSSETIIYLGGIYNIFLIIFHLSFWKIFKWKKELRRMNFLNGSVYQILNTPLGNITLKLIAFFWFFRALQQIYFFGIKNLISLGFVIYFLIGTVIYIYPAL